MTIRTISLKACMATLDAPKPLNRPLTMRRLSPSDLAYVNAVLGGRSPYRSN